MCLTRGLFRLALIGGLAAGGAVLLIGPEHVAAGFAQIRTQARQAVDSMIDDPVALRHQLQTLASEYPEKIATLRGELAEVDRQIAQLEHDSAVAQRVVSNTSEDITDLTTLMARAEQASTGGRNVVVVFDARRLDASDAQEELRRIQRIRADFQERSATSQQHLGYLSQQRTRLASMLDKLVTEQQTFEQQMAAIDRKIDAIARNERLVELIKERESALADFDTQYRSTTLNQLEGKLAEWQARVDAEFEVLERKTFAKDYEDAARWEIQSERQVDEFGDEAETTSTSHGDDLVILPTGEDSLAQGPVVIRSER